MIKPEIDTKHLEGKRVFWSNRWDKLWLLIIPVLLLVDIFSSDRYSIFWFWAILVAAGGFCSYVLYHMFHPKFAWVDTTTKEGKEILEKAFDLRYGDTGEFQYTAEGFEFFHNKLNHSIQWIDIEAVFAYKRDLMTTDELVLDVFTKNSTRLHLTEEVPGWYQFIEKLKEIFPHIDKEFDVKLMFPPFVTNLTLVYDIYSRTLEEATASYYN